MQEIAEGVFYSKGFPPNANSYVLGNTLINAGTRHNVRRQLRRLRGRTLDVLTFTHVHPPTQGAAHALSDALDIEVWCGAGDAGVLASGDLLRAQPNRAFNRFQQRFFTGPGVKPARLLSEGDEVEGFEVLETPGHAPGHLAFWRAADRVLIVGDVVTNENVWTGLPGLREPPPIFTPDPVENRRSAQRLAQLEPATVCFDHGGPLRDGNKFTDFITGLG